MNRRLVFIPGGLIFFLVLIYVGILINDNQLHELEDLSPPYRISSYWETGYYKIDPETILASLRRGDTSVFTPLPEEEALALEELTGLSIYWTQADFLKIASAVGQYAWDDPMDLKEWSVYSIDLDGSCGDRFGFDYASITYFKTGRNSYTTRFIEMHPYFQWVRWGNGKTYPKPILQKWNRVDLRGSKITADDALGIVNENVKAHFQIKENICGVMTSSSRYDSENWDLLIIRGSLDPVRYTVNFDTGDIVYPQWRPTREQHAQP